MLAKVTLSLTFVALTFNNVLSQSGKKNVLGGDLEVCSTDPMTGWYRQGYCQTDDNDFGTHTMCCEMTDDVRTKIIFSIVTFI